MGGLLERAFVCNRWVDGDGFWWVKGSVLFSRKFCLVYVVGFYLDVVFC